MGYRQQRGEEEMVRGINNKNHEAPYLFEKKTKRNEAYFSA